VPKWDQCVVITLDNSDSDGRHDARPFVTTREQRFARLLIGDVIFPGRGDHRKRSSSSPSATKNVFAVGSDRISKLPPILRPDARKLDLPRGPVLDANHALPLGALGRHRSIKGDSRLFSGPA
jgi:hypothetical protein